MRLAFIRVSRVLLFYITLSQSPACVLDTKNNENFNDEMRVECIIPTIKPNSLQTGKINQRVYESYYAATDILTVRMCLQYI